MNFSVITLFPEMFNAIKVGITGRAIEEKIISLTTINPRDFTKDKHHTVDDRPYGGGPGMVMKVEPLQMAIEHAKENIKDKCKVIYLSPQGKVFKQNDAKNFSQQKNLILLAGRYEGIDERLIKHHIDEEWSIGDYVISGGELAAMVMIDSITRLLPGALGHEFSAEYDSFVDGLLDYPHYTRPENINGEIVPNVLLSGDHEKIRKYRLKQALGRTWLRRPELIHARIMTQEEKDLLQEFISEMEKKHEQYNTTN